MRLVGVDISVEALEYARSAGFIEDGVHADLEDRDPTDHERAQLTGTDVVISTGCIGYATERTIARLATPSSIGAVPGPARNVRSWTSR